MKENLGVLMPVASLPSRHGIGDFGESSIRFISFLKKHKYRYWQVLPLNPIGPGESPYMSTSSFAFDYRYISLDKLIEEGLLDEVPDYRKDEEQIIYWKIGEFKRPYLYKAYLNFIKKFPNGLDKFKKNNPWVKKFATFQVFKEENNLKSWITWPKWQKDYYINHRCAPKEYKDQMDFVIFMQLKALEQWKEVLSYAHKNKIKIIADMPFYVGLDSMEVWLNKSDFLLNENDLPTLVAGVPPDYFSSKGQLWGSPIYNFENLKKNKYKMMVDRLSYLAKTCDILRIDHFRAFDTYYVIPADREDAVVGEWKVGPREDFFKCLYEKSPNIKLIAEDLGELFNSVRELKNNLNLPGMYIVQFNIFSPGLESDKTMIVYPGTHDNDTLFGWFLKLDEHEIDIVKNRINYKEGDLFDCLMEYIYSLPSLMTIFPLQDLLKLDSKARINVPGTVGEPNWMWRLPSWDFLDKIIYPK